VWTYDFIRDATVDGRWIRFQTVEDESTRECLATEADTRFPARSVTAVLEQLFEERGTPPRKYQCDGPLTVSRFVCFATVFFFSIRTGLGPYGR